MTDLALQVAEYLTEGSPASAGDILNTVAERWPDLTREEWERAHAIAEELVAARIAEGKAEVAALQATMKGARR